jgi:hypothetical protein
MKPSQSPSIHQELQPDGGPQSVDTRHAPKRNQQWCYRCNESHDRHPSEGKEAAPKKT